MRDRLLASWPAGSGISEDFMLVSSCGEFAVVVTSRSRFLRRTKLIVCSPGRESPPFGRVLRPQASLDGRHFTYGASPGRGRWVVVVDGEFVGPAFDEIGAPVFKPDGTRVAWRGRRGNRWHMVIDGRPGLPFDDVMRLTFPPGADRAAFVAVDRAGGQFVVVDDWILASSWAEVRFLTFSPDAGRLAYAARAGDSWFVVENGVVRTKCEDIHSIDYLSDGRLACGVRRQGRWWMEVADQEYGPYDRLWEFSAHESTPRHAFAAVVNGSEFMVVDGEKGPEFDQVGCARFSVDGRVAYYGKVNSTEHVVFDQRPGPGFDSVHGLKFRPDGRAFAYAGISGRKARPVILGGAELMMGRLYDQVWCLRWSADGGTLAFIAVQPTCRRVVIGDVEGAPHDIVCAPVIGPDGAVVVYGATDGAREFMVIDEEVLGPFDEVWPPSILADGRTVVFATRTGNEVWWNMASAASP